jgi:YVTN family beta-propeller protein
VLDVSNKSNPRLISNISLYTLERDDYNCFLAIEGDYAFVTREKGNALFVVDVHDKWNPQVVGTLRDGENMTNPYGIAVRDNYAYITSRDDNSLYVIDVSTKETPVSVGVLKDDVALPAPYRVEIKDNYAFVSGLGVQVVDVSDPALPVLVNNLSDPRYLTDMKLSGNYALGVTRKDWFPNDLQFYVIDTLPSSG